MSNNNLTGNAPLLPYYVNVDYSDNCMNVTCSEFRRASYCAVPTCVTPPAVASEKAALLDLFASTEGATSWGSVTGWGAESDPCVDSWYGVHCTGGVPNHVTYVRNGMTRLNSASVHPPLRLLRLFLVCSVRAMVYTFVLFLVLPQAAGSFKQLVDGVSSCDHQLLALFALP